MRINIYGSPGSGKSKLCAKIYDYLKGKHISCEMCREYVKDWAYKKTPIDGYMNVEAVVNHLNQEYNLLHHKRVKAIITDSPVLLGLFYAKHHKALGARGLEMILMEHEKIFPSINLLLKLNTSFPYDTAARYQDQKESYDLQYKIFAEVSTFYSTHCKKNYVLKSINAGDEQQENDILKYLKEELK